MKKLLLSLLLLPFLVSGQVTENGVRSVITQRLSKQIRPIDLRQTLNLITHYARQADSTALAAVEMANNVTVTMNNVAGLEDALSTYQPLLGYTPVNQSASYDNPSFISSLPKAKVGLSNVENYSPANMPVSTAQAAINATKEPLITPGLTTQFFRGDKTWATVTIPTSNDFIATSGNQTAIAGNKTAASGTTWNFHNLTFGGTFLPATSGALFLGSPTVRMGGIYSDVFGSAGSPGIGSTTATQPVYFFSGPSTTANRFAEFKGTTGNLHLYAPGTSIVDQQVRLYVGGKVKITDIVNINPPVYANDAAALTGGLQLGDIYRESSGVLRIVVAITGPVYTESVGNLLTRTIFAGTPSERRYKAQNADETWSIQKTAGSTPPVFRFENRPGDVWPTDETNGNDQNGNYKERTEMYNINPTTLLGYNTPWESVQWISYQIRVAPGPDVTYTNDDHYCDLGQWHAKSGVGQATMFIKFDGADRFRFFTHGGTVAGSGTLRHTANLARGTWHKIVMRIKHSNTAGQGEFRLYINSTTPVVDLTGIDLGIRGESDAGYWKFGIYRTAADDGTVGGEIDRRVTLITEYANMEISETALDSRISSPLPITNTP